VYHVQGRGSNSDQMIPRPTSAPYPASIPQAGLGPFATGPSPTADVRPMTARHYPRLGDLTLKAKATDDEPMTRQTLPTPHMSSDAKTSL